MAFKRSPVRSRSAPIIDTFKQFQIVSNVFIKTANNQYVGGFFIALKPDGITRDSLTFLNFFGSILGSKQLFEFFTPKIKRLGYKYLRISIFIAAHSAKC